MDDESITPSFKEGSITALVFEGSVVQVEDDFILAEEVNDTTPMTVPPVHVDALPEPPLPEEVELAQGTLINGPRVQRNAAIYAAVRRPSDVD